MYLFIVVFFVYTYINTIRADEANFLSEEYVMLIINKKPRNTFYKVFVNNEENPYLNVKEILKEYLDFTNIKCSFSDLRCSAVLPETKAMFWVDFKHKFFGYFGDKKEKKLDNNMYIVSKNSFYLRYDVFAKWLPLRISWKISTYTIKIMTEFKLLEQLKKEKRLERLKQIEQKKKKKDFENREVIIAPSKIYNNSLLSLSLNQNFNKPINLRTGFDSCTDIFSGSLYFGGSVNYEPNILGNNILHYRYVQKKKEYYDILELGNTFFRNIDLLLPYFRVNNGLNIETQKQKYSIAQMTIEDSAPVGTEVDLYIDNIYYATTKVTENGRYKFEDVVVSSYSSVYIKLFYPDGIRETKYLSISRDNETIIKKDKHVEKITTGQTDYGYFFYTSLRYGLIDNLSLGLHNMVLPGNKDLSMMFDASLKPFYGVNLFSQLLTTFSKDRVILDTATRINISLFYPNLIQFEYKYYDINSPVLFNFKRHSGNNFILRYDTRFSKVYFNSTYESYLKRKKIESKLRFRVARYLDLNLGLQNYFYKKLNYSKVETGLNFRSYIGRFELSRMWGNNVVTSSTKIEYTKRRLYTRAISLMASVIWEDRNNILFNGNIIYNKDAFSIGMVFTDSYVGLNLLYRNVIIGKPKNWKDYAKGTVVGRLLTPNNLPIQYAKVVVDNKKAITDQDGNFIIRGITPYQKHKIFVDPESLSLDYYPEKDFDVVYLRPSTYIEYNPKIIRVSGFDCTLMTPKELSGDTLIKITNLKTNILFKTIEIEPDGFFVVEKIPPGTYKLELVSDKIKKLPKPKIITIPETSEWLSNVVWNWD